MAVQRATVVHDAATLYRFVDSVCAVAENRSSSVYVRASERFFEYIRELGKQTKAYLVTFPSGLPVQDLLKDVYRQKLTVLRDAWAELHQFLKPAIDADTLNTPFSLLQAYYRRIQRIAGFESVEFTVFHLNEVNYLQVRASWFKQLASKLGSQIPHAPKFPVDLGLIGIPYSQSSSIFLNSLIPHEMGHYVYQQRGFGNGLTQKASVHLNSVLGPAVLSPIDRRWCIDKISSWAEEIFCDLFAVGMIGPAYVFAYIELLDLARIPTDPSTSSHEEYLSFGSSHPADFCRLAQHSAFLRDLGWWPLIAEFKTHYIHVLKQVEMVQSDAYIFHSDMPNLATSALKAFIYLMPDVKDVVVSVLAGLDSGVSAYKKFAPLVQDYLHAGIVPSTVWMAPTEEDSLSEFLHPDPISVLNTSYKIHLESVDILLKQVGKPPDAVDARSEWATHLELWASKAFEDYLLLIPST